MSPEPEPEPEEAQGDSNSPEIPGLAIYDEMLASDSIFIDTKNPLVIRRNSNITTHCQTLPAPPTQSILDKSQQELEQSEAYVDSTLPRSIQADSKSSIIKENYVLQKLLRKGRYFDYRDGSSYIKAHTAINSSTKKLGRPCYICGQFNHFPKRCPKRRICPSCNRRGHIAVDCPVNNDCIMCLRCGGSGHELFSCSVEYSPDDLKNVRCYVCNELGHICCGNYTDVSAEAASCYHCGQSGHLGLQCSKPHQDDVCSWQPRPPPICYKCGGDHSARKCQKDDGIPACHKRQQGSGLDFVVEAENRKTARRSKTYNHRKVKKQKISGLLEFMAVQYT